MLNLIKKYNAKINLLEFLFLVAIVLFSVYFFWPFIPKQMAFVTYIIGSCLILFGLAQWRPLWALFLLLLTIPGVTNLTVTIFSKSADYSLNRAFLPVYSFLQKYLGLFDSADQMGVFGPISLILASAFIFGVWFRKIIRKQSLAPNRLLWPLLAFMALTLLSAIVAIWRYSDFWPLINFPYYDQIINLKGQTAAGAFSTILWALCNYLIGPALLLAVIQVGWESKSNKNEPYHHLPWIAKWILLPLFIGSILPLLVGIYQTQNIWFGANKVYIWPWARRINATFFDPNALGAYIVLFSSWTLASLGLLRRYKGNQTFVGLFVGFVVLASLLLVFKLSPFKENNILVITYIISILGLIIFKKFHGIFGGLAAVVLLYLYGVLMINSGSRMATCGVILIIIFSVVFLLLLLLKKAKVIISPHLYHTLILIVILAYSAFSGLAFYVGAPKLVERFSKNPSIQKTSLFRRIQKMPFGSLKGFYNQIMTDRGPYAAVAMSIIKEAPLSGIGLGCFIFEIENWKKVNDVVVFVPDTACNYYLQIAAEQGLVSLIAILLFYFLWWSEWWKVWGEAEGRWYWMMIGVGMATMMVVFIFGMHTLAHEIQCLFWIFLAQPLLAFKTPTPKIKLNKFFWIFILLFISVNLIFAYNRISLECGRARFGWDKNFGFFKWERWLHNSPRMRYTDKIANLVLPVELPSFTMPFACYHPDISSNNPVNVAFQFANHSTNYVIYDSLWRNLQFNMKIDQLGSKEIFEIKCSRTWSPVDFGATNDFRDLGIVVQDYKWSNNSGNYDILSWNDDGGFMQNKAYCWTAQNYRILLQDDKPYFVLPLLVSHPDVTQRPVHVAVSINENIITNLAINDDTWNNYIVKIPDHDFKHFAGKVIFGLDTDRTWTPLDFEIKDERKLGVAVGTILNTDDWGFFVEDLDPAGFNFRWADKAAVWPVKANQKGLIYFDFLIQHPFIHNQPVTFELFADEKLVLRKIVDIKGWNSFVITNLPNARVQLRAQVNRVFSPSDNINKLSFGFATLTPNTQRAKYKWPQNYGFYDPELMNGVPIQSSQLEGMIYTTIDGFEYSQSIACFHPNITNQPVDVSVELGGHSTNLMINDHAWHKIYFDFDKDQIGIISQFKVKCDRTWSPRDLGIDTDLRKLGLVTQPPKWSNSKGLFAKSLWSESENLMSAKDYAWSEKQASMILSASNTKSFVTLPILVSHPDITNLPVELALALDNQLLTNIVFKTAGWHNIVLENSIDLILNSNTNLGSNDILILDLSVDRTWCPKDFGIDDERQLGVGLGPIASTNIFGFYGLESWPTGFKYRWASKHAIWQAKTKPNGMVDVDVMTNHKDDGKPLLLTIVINDKHIYTQKLALQGWQTFSFPGQTGKLNDIKATINRTFCPADAGGNDNRQLGFAIQQKN